ncbi:MAG: LptF/LptG family permease [Negativicutes bacterium]
MRILDRYILKELLGPFLFGIAVFASILVGTGPLFRIAQYISQYGASLWTCAKLLAFSLPGIIALTFPMAMLLASLMAFGRLSSSSEIVAMKCGGLSFYRLATPVFLAAFFVSVFSMTFNEFMVPRANAAYTYLVHYEIMKNTRPKSQDHIVIKDISGGNLQRLTYARRFDEGLSLMQGVTIQEYDKDVLVRIENAEKAVWKDGAWTMLNGTIYDMSEDGRVERTLRFKEQSMPVEKPPAAISRSQKRPEEMTIRELKQHITVLKREQVRSSFFEVELHQRIAVPFACLVFSMIGVPLGIQRQRSSSSIGLGISVIVIFIYYTIMSMGMALGQGGTLPAFTAVWIPNLLGIIAGAFFIHRASK